MQAILSNQLDSQLAIEMQKTFDLAETDLDTK